MRSSWLEVDLNALRHNFNLLKSKLSPNTLICGVVKANAYGHGAVPISQALLEFGCHRLAVARAGEANVLRSAGISCPIHIVGSLGVEDAVEAVKAKAIPSIASIETAKKLARVSPGAEIHVIVDSGMNRVGVQEQHFTKFMKEIHKTGLRVTGYYTHMASADEPEQHEFTLGQLSRFRELTEVYRGPGIIRHAANSATILRYAQEGQFEMVRPGVALYGLPPSEHFIDDGLKPIATWKAYPTQVKQLERGDTVGYGRTYVAQGGEWIATLPVGYGDGFFRQLSSKGAVRLAASRELCCIIGRVSMDQITVLLPHKLDLDSVFLIATNDFDEITSFTGRAKQLGTINYEMGTALADRIPRMYIPADTHHKN